MVPTNESTLGELFTAAIAAIQPRSQYKGAEGWKPHNRETSTSNRTRSFRLVWTNGGLETGSRGAMGGRIFGHFAELRVRTDYAGEHAKQQALIIDDFHQLADTLAAAKSPSNGLMYVARLRVEALKGSPTDRDVVRVDHVFRINYLRQIQL
jgi:hypothetical protein